MHTPQQATNWTRFGVAGLFFATLLLTLVFGMGGSVAGAAQPKPASKVSDRVLSDAASGETAVLITIADKADLSAAFSISDQDARGWYVYNKLHDEAARSQASIRSLLNARGVAYQSFWIANALSLRADRALIDLLAARSDVSKISSDEPTSGIDEPISVSASDERPNAPDTVEWGVQNVNAPALWTMGYTGQGIVVGGADTGIRWSHEALIDHYRGWNGSTANHNYNWYDAIRTQVVGGSICGYANAVPCDDYYHGSHTIGTAVGGVGSNEIGVAPGAEWIGCRNMDGGVGRPSTYMGCYQFMMAPTDTSGNNPNPALRAHVVNNSWGCPQSEQCDDPNILLSTVEAATASGVFLVSSAGNSGSSCNTVNEPSAIYASMFTVGAIDISNTLAGFSSRGPVTVDGSNRIKPNIAGPGVSVRSVDNDSDVAYTISGGTSMAAPHVAGVVALLWSARPDLARNISATMQLLEQSANPDVDAGSQVCGGTSSADIPNNLFGYGRVDALTAYNLAQDTIPTSTATATTTPATATTTRTATATATATVPATTTTTATATATATPTGISCTINFSDVTTTDYFYTPVQYLFCAGVISGYEDNTFRPFNDTTRAQIAKIIVLASGWPINASGGPHFNDVPASHPFYSYIETYYNRFTPAIIGYDDGSFRPYNKTTRGQLSKLIVVSQGWAIETPAQPSFSDVSSDNPFYSFIETAHAHGIISGYANGTFGWGATATRGQISKIVYLAVR